MISPMISVVLPVHNCPDYISEAIKSILNQTFENFEFIIIDDGSTDNTTEIARTRIIQLKLPGHLLIRAFVSFNRRIKALPLL